MRLISPAGVSLEEGRSWSSGGAGGGTVRAPCEHLGDERTERRRPGVRPPCHARLAPCGGRRADRARLPRHVTEVPSGREARRVRKWWRVHRFATHLRGVRTPRAGRKTG